MVCTKSAQAKGFSRFLPNCGCLQHGDTDDLVMMRCLPPNISSLSFLLLTAFPLRRRVILWARNILDESPTTPFYPRQTDGMRYIRKSLPYTAMPVAQMGWYVTTSRLTAVAIMSHFILNIPVLWRPHSDHSRLCSTTIVIRCKIASGTGIHKLSLIHI